MAIERLSNQPSKEEKRIGDPEIAREAAEAERPLRNAVHHGKGFLRNKLDLQSDVEKLAEAVGIEAAETAQKLKQVHGLIWDGRDILQAAGVLGALIKYAEQLEERLPTNRASGK